MRKFASLIWSQTQVKLLHQLTKFDGKIKRLLRIGAASDIKEPGKPANALMEFEFDWLREENVFDITNTHSQTLDFGSLWVLKIKCPGSWKLFSISDNPLGRIRRRLWSDCCQVCFLGLVENNLWGVQRWKLLSQYKVATNLLNVHVYDCFSSNQENLFDFSFTKAACSAIYVTILK